MTLPQTIGHYRVLGELATGGMAEIVLARVEGPSGFQRPVVLKRILPHLARQKKFVEMFLDEARIVAGIRHPNVIQVYELSQEESELFLVMEYLEGEPVSGLMKRLHARHEELDRRLGAFLVAEVCAGLHAAHEVRDPTGAPLGVVHRDISPQNLFVTYDGHVKLLDFGVAHAAGRSTRTEAGHVKGKFQYMSPEQCRSQPLDRRSDIFALGVVLYELTTGRILFKRESSAATIRAICEPIIPPSRVVFDYPECLERICLRALGNTPDERYATCAEMRKALLQAIATLGAMVEPAIELSTLMRRVFADRIAEKEDLLRKVEVGSEISQIPVNETDEGVELPPATVAETGSAHRQRLRRRWIPFAAVAIVLATGAVTVGLLARPRPVVAQAASPTSVPASPIPPPLPTEEPASPPATITVHLETQPPGAHVVRDGSALGTTPFDLQVTRSSDPTAVELVLPGYATSTQRFTPDRDQRLLLVLHRRSAPPKPTPKATKAPPSGFSRYE